ncbi:MAG: PEP-CTERM sorting domain-containing protein [Thermodesulfobacteriota bacterium]
MARLRRFWVIQLLFILFLGVFLFTSAQAEIIVDTGTLKASECSRLYENQWIAGQFNISESYNITDIYGWIDPYNSTGTMTIALYGDSGDPSTDWPDTTNEYLAQQFIPSSDGADWYGLTGLNTLLVAGTYWVSFEVRSDDTNYGSMPKEFSNPLPVMAYYNGSKWIGYDDIPVGIRIYGDTQAASVPEPASMFLLGSALLGLVGLGKRKLRKH